MKNTKELTEILLDLIRQYPNDADLGKQFRAVVNRYANKDRESLKTITEFEKFLITSENAMKRIEFIKSIQEEIQGPTGKTLYSADWILHKFLKIQLDE